MQTNSTLGRIAISQAPSSYHRSGETMTKKYYYGVRSFEPGVYPDWYVLLFSHFTQLTSELQALSETGWAETRAKQNLAH
jgi:hypothetical protein